MSKDKKLPDEELDDCINEILSEQKIRKNLDDREKQKE